MRKSLVCFAFGLLMYLLTGVGCTGKDPKSITIWHSFRPTDRTVFQQALSEFASRHAGWTFNELYYEPEQARTNFIISALGGSGPELFWGANDNIGPFVELDVIMPLENLFTQDFLDSFVVEPVNANTWMNGHMYQLGDRVGNHLCLVYNKKLVSKPPQTMSELLAMGKKFSVDKDGDGKPDRYALVWNFTEPYFVVPFIGGYGGWIINEQNQPTLDTEAVVKAARFIYELSRVHKIIPAECDYEIANALFKDGLSAMIINGSWAWGTYIDNGIDIGIARIPKIDDTGLWPTPAISPLGYSLNKNIKKEKMALVLELVKYVTADSIELRFTQSSGAIPSRKAAFTSPQVAENEVVRGALDQLMVGQEMSPVTEMRWIWDAMRPSYQGIFSGRVSPEQAARDMQAQAMKLIRENRE
ncbi:MAG TPA: extracellular solute-binding protein [bacterium]|nr:extracellular solute-binding protein [bacterium]HPN45008.1 extracellular solute-binding protein [bacterium]